MLPKLSGKKLMINKLKVKLHFLANNVITVPFWNVFSILPKKYKIVFMLLQLASFISAGAELISIGALYPFLLSITNPELVNEIQIIAYLLEIFSIKSDENVILFLCIFFAFAAFVSGVVRIAVIYSQTRFAFDVGHILSRLTFQTTIHRDYEWHIKNNSSKAIAVITQKSAGVVANFFIPLLAANTSVIFLIFVLMTGMLIQPVAILSMGIVVACLYYLIIARVGKTISRNGLVINEKMTQSVKVIIESLGAIREIVLNRYQQRFIKEFEVLDRDLKNAHASNAVLKIIPKLVVELLSLMLLALGSIIALQVITVETFFAVAGVTALCLQKVLPNAQSIYHAYASFKNGAAALTEVLDFVDYHPFIAGDDQSAELSFRSELKLVNVWYRYEDTKPWVLSGVNLTINKGEKLCLLGASGAGKSTLIDIILGLLEPVSGEIFIDGKKLNLARVQSWRKKISHSPQQIFLFDATLEDNILLGKSRKVIEKSWQKAIKSAELGAFISSLPDGELTNTGEAGIGLSGGQKQRTGLARAFIQERELYVFDEGTSALDKQMEKKILTNIAKYYGDKTILFSTHSIEVTNHVDRVIRIEDGKIKEQMMLES